MANTWFRCYSEFASDPKVQMMSEADQRRLVMLFCLRCDETLETLHETELAFHLRISEEELARTKALFIDKNFIDKHWNLQNWNSRQFLSDSSTDRVRRYRQAKKQDETLHKRNETLHETTNETDATKCNALDTDTDTDTEQRQNREKKQKQAPAAKAAPLVLPPWIDSEAWAAFEEMRKRLRKPMTPRARELILAKLQAYEARGHDSTAILNNSVVNSWQDVYEPKPQFESRKPYGKPAAFEQSLAVKQMVLDAREARRVADAENRVGGGAEAGFAGFESGGQRLAFGPVLARSG